MLSSSSGVSQSNPLQPQTESVVRQATPKVAVLLPTYNGARYVDAQIFSLTRNDTPFTLHWLDDHSGDQTRAVVRASAEKARVELREWHQPGHLGFPASFLQLMEHAEADIYLFCDQDDIWQPHKIDVTVANLLADVEVPALCFSLASWFNDAAPEKLHHPSVARYSTIRSWVQESQVFTLCPAQGHTIGFSRPLRDLYVTHKDIARTHAIDHDWWLYILATATGVVKMLEYVPTTLHRFHMGNCSNAYVIRGSRNRLQREWQREQSMRKRLAQQARGFVSLFAALPETPRRDRLLAVAKLVAQIDRRQSPFTLLRLARLGAMSRWWGRTFFRTAVCLCSDAS
jgi:glycosyltransferase involved in cell wall biosynthesis